MRMLYASYDQSALERFSQILSASGVACEIRAGDAGLGCSQYLARPELWVKGEKEFRMALRVLAANWQTAQPIVA